MKGTGEKELPVHKRSMCLSNVDLQDPLQKLMNSGINISQLQPSRAPSYHSPRRLYRQNTLSMSSHCWRGRPTRRCPIGFQCNKRGNHLSHGIFFLTPFCRDRPQVRELFYWSASRHWDCFYTGQSRDVQSPRQSPLANQGGCGGSRLGSDRIAAKFPMLF